MTFFLPMNPPTATHQEKRVAVVKGKPTMYEDARLKAARQKLMAYLAAHRPEQPMTGALQLRVMWLFHDKSHRFLHGDFKTTKPDTDNLNKLLKDCMTACHFWKDDAQVAVEHIEKHWVHEKPGILIEVTCLDDVQP